MTRFFILSISVLLTLNAFSQNKNLSDYSYIVVPDQFDFLNEKDQFQLNSMTKFYFEKSGYNAYLSELAPNANRCDGLYANVEKLKMILGTKLQIVIKDCNDVEIYRSSEGKSKYKEFDKSYQDALRKAFSSIEGMGVKQKDIVLLADKANATAAEETLNEPVTKVVKPKASHVSGNILPDSKFSNYSSSGKTFLLRKTTEGYSLYEEATTAADGLLLKGKIIVMGKIVKYMDVSGNSYDATFDPSGNLTIKNDAMFKVFKAEN